MFAHRDNLTGPRTPAARGFTLIEMVVVMAILAILLLIIVTVGTSVKAYGKQKQTRTDVEVIHSAIMAYNEIAQQFPVQLADLMRYEKTDKMLRGHFPGKQFVTDATGTIIIDIHDIYGRPFIYLSNGGAGGTPVVVSAGEDVGDNLDDIRSDDRKGGS